MTAGLTPRILRLRARASGGCIVGKNSKGEVKLRRNRAAQCKDSYGHGTAVGGIIADLAPKVHIVNVRVLDEHNACTGDELIAGLKWALDRNFRLLNMRRLRNQSGFQIFLNCAKGPLFKTQSLLRRAEILGTWDARLANRLTAKNKQKRK